MTNIPKKQLPYNTLPLWQAERQRRYRELPYAAKRLATNMHVEPEVARLIADLACLGRSDR